MLFANFHWLAGSPLPRNGMLIFSSNLLRTMNILCVNRSINRNRCSNIHRELGSTINLIAEIDAPALSDESGPEPWSGYSRLDGPLTVVWWQQSCHDYFEFPTLTIVHRLLRRFTVLKASEQITPSETGRFGIRHKKLCTMCFCGKLSAHSLLWW